MYLIMYVDNQRPEDIHNFNIKTRHSSEYLSETTGRTVFRIRMKICLLDPDPQGQMRIRIHEVKKPRKYTVSLDGNIKVRILLY